MPNDVQEAAQHVVRPGPEGCARDLVAAERRASLENVKDFGAFSPSGERLSKQHSLHHPEPAADEGPAQGLKVSPVHDFHFISEAGLSGNWKGSTPGDDDEWATFDFAASGVEQGQSPGSKVPQDAVFMRGEILKNRDLKVLQAVIHFAVFCGIALLATGLYFRTKDKKVLYRSHKVQVLNVIFGSFCLVLILMCLANVLRNVHIANKKNCSWSHRRRFSCTQTFLEGCVQAINLVFLLVPNIHSLSQRCAWFSQVSSWSAFVRWTSWNTIFVSFLLNSHSLNPWHKDEEDSVVLDAPIGYHWAKAVLWLTVECVLVAVAVHLHSSEDWAVVANAPIGADCRETKYECGSNRAAAWTLSLAVMFCVLIYIGIFLKYVNTTFASLKVRPYKEHRMAHILIRLQSRLRAMAMGFFLVNLAIYLFIDFPSCEGFAMALLGLLPAQVVTSCVEVCWSYIMSPMTQADVPPTLQVQLQDFAWTKREKHSLIAERGGGRPGIGELCGEPMFCFETALEMYYWSMLVYHYKQVDDSPYTAETALQLSGCEHLQLFWEPAQDTKVLVAWGEHNIVVAFRGTASMANVMADMQIWRTAHPPVRGNLLLGTRPMVHQGFLKSWTANGLNQRIIDCVSNAVLRSGGGVRVRVTGHSLGGALATLAAIDIRLACKGLGDADIECYTFGAPRTGNHAFARAYNQAVPETWHVINDQDAVARGGKFVLLYKRPGHRVLLNSQGDMVVRPSTMEISVLRVPGGSSVKQHLLTQYRGALLAVCLAQVGHKRFKGGTQGLLALLERGVMRELLKSAGLQAEAVRSWAFGNGALTPIAESPAPRRSTPRAMIKSRWSGEKSTLEVLREAATGHEEQPLPSDMTSEQTRDLDIEMGAVQPPMQGLHPSEGRNGGQLLSSSIVVRTHNNANTG